MRKRNNNWKDIKTKVYVCAVCSKEFVRSAYMNYKYCSVACASISRIGNTHAKGNGPNQTSFTSERVRGSNSPSWKESIQFKCELCGNLFKLKPWQVKSRQRNSNSEVPRFCSRTCFLTSGVFKGEKSVNYVGGKNTCRGRKWLEARQKAVDRDNGTCQNCHKFIGNGIPVHHIKPFREFETEEEANVLDNLICMCQSCHMKHEPRKSSSSKKA